MSFVNKKFTNEFIEFQSGLKKCQLCWRITGYIFLANLAAEEIILFFSVIQFKNDRIYEIEREALVITRSILRIADDTINIPQNISNTGLRLLWNLQQTHYNPIIEQNVLDAAWPPMRTRSSYNVVARIDITNVDLQVKAYIWRIVGLVLLISIVVTIVAMIVLSRLVFHPILQLRDRLSAITRNFDNSSNSTKTGYGTDELSEVTKDFDLLTLRLNESFDQLSQFHERLASQLTLAAEMQTELIPTSVEIRIIETLYNVQTASYFRPSSELGGDTWSLHAIDDDRFGILIVDFSGHGVSAAMNTFRLHTMLNRRGVSKTTPSEYLQAINAEIVTMMPIGQFCTMFYAVIDIKCNTLTYAGAGTPPSLVRAAWQ